MNSLNVAFTKKGKIVKMTYEDIEKKATTKERNRWKRRIEKLKETGGHSNNNDYCKICALDELLEAI